MKMKFLLVAFAAIAMTASCNNQPAESNKSSEKTHDEMRDMKMDSMKMGNMDSSMHSNHQLVDSMHKK